MSSSLIPFLHQFNSAHFTANSTRLLLDGKMPSAFSPALQNRRIKSDLVRAVKAKKYPAGLGIPGMYSFYSLFPQTRVDCFLKKYSGVFQLFLDDQQKPPEERYIHCCRTTKCGGLLIVTGVPFLIRLLDDPGVSSFEDDTTFKRVAGELNEWELAFYLKAVQRGPSSTFLQLIILKL